MNANSEAIFVLIALIIFGIVITYNGYMAWFRPVKFRDIYVKNFERSPDWWPLRNFYMSWLRSSVFLWAFRSMTLIVLLGMIFMLVQTISGIFEIFLK